MLTFFRRFFQSKIGVVVTLAFLALIAFAFASADVSSTGTFGGVAGGERVAVVGDEKIGSGELTRSANRALEQVRAENPTISMPGFLEQDGLTSVLDSLIGNYALREFAEMIGLRAGDNLVNSEILTVNAFRGADGNFSEDAYRGAIGQAGLTDAMVRDDFATSLLTRQLLQMAQFGAVMPDKLARRYAALFRERREGAIALLPSAAFAPKGDATDKQLQSYYSANRGDYIRPERRTLRYATFGEDALDASIEPTSNEIAARYNRDKAQYSASEERTISQIIVPTQSAARSLAGRVNSGASLNAVAQEASFRVANIGPIRRADLASQTSPALAQAVFAAPRGKVAEPARSPLGWHVAVVDAVNAIGGRSLAEARGEITTALRAEKRRNALGDLSARVEEQLDRGQNLAEVADELGLELKTTQPLTGDGTLYGKPQERAPELLLPALATAFQMREAEPQLAEVERGETFLIFETSQITESATAPLGEIRDQVQADWKLAQGSAAAQKAADRVMKRLADGSSMAAALRAEEATLPPPQNINLTREQLASQQDRAVPPPLALLFSMAEKTTKKLSAAQNLGWFVVNLQDIDAGTLSDDDPLLAQAKAQLGPAVGRDYAEQLQTAIQRLVGVEKNDAAIEAVRKQLAGET